MVESIYNNIHFKIYSKYGWGPPLDPSSIIVMVVLSTWMFRQCPLLYYKGAPQLFFLTQMFWPKHGYGMTMLPPNLSAFFSQDHSPKVVDNYTKEKGQGRPTSEHEQT